MKKSQFCTHEVVNQSHPLVDVNLFSQDKLLQEISRLWIDDPAHREDLIEAGTEYGAASSFEAAHLANVNPPIFTSHDNYGHRIDRVDYHPSYHKLMELGLKHGLCSRPWKVGTSDAHMARAIKLYLHNQIEQGSSCPITMTFAVTPALQHGKKLFKKWMPYLFSEKYDPSLQALKHKTGALFGMAMTEKQGGSDVRSNLTTATPVPNQKGAYELVGHKWFCSAPMSDGFLSLAQTTEGLSCFLVPRYDEEGELNNIRIQRLKNKLGNKSNASAEIEFTGARAQLLGEAGKGVRTIIEMVSVTRIDCMIASAAIMRQALSQAIHHCSHRRAFGARLIDQALMQNVLADLALESEAATWLAMRAAKALGSSNKEEALLLRLLTGVGKFWICKRATYFTHEAQESLGGLGYIEDHVMPRLYREAPVNSIWEGSGNVQCLDILRAIQKNPEALEIYMVEVSKGKGKNEHFDSYLANEYAQIQAILTEPSQARRVAEFLAKALQGSLLIRFAPPFVYEAWCESRLLRSSEVFGSLEKKTAFSDILMRAT